MTDIQPDISEIPADEVAPAPSEAPYVEPTAAEPTAEPVVAEATAEPAEPAAAKAPRRPRTELEPRVKEVCDAYVAGGFTLEDDAALTPHRIARRLSTDDVKVSTGAVAGVLSRWDTYGFARVSEKPLAFVDYTDAGREQGLTALKAAHATATKERKAAIKAAEAPAATEAPAAEVSTPETPAPEASASVA